MPARPERPEDHQTQGASGTYKECRRTIHELKNRSESESADERVPVEDLELGVSFLRHAAQAVLAG